MKKPIANSCAKHSTDGNPTWHTWTECSQNPANAKASLSSRECHGHNSHHMEIRSPSPSCLRSPSPRSDNDCRRSSSPSNRSYASGASVDNYTTFAEPMKPPTRKQCKSSQAESSCKCNAKKHHMKSIDDHIPCKRHCFVTVASKNAVVTDVGTPSDCPLYSSVYVTLYEVVPLVLPALRW